MENHSRVKWFGTHEGVYIWMNSTDATGILFSSIVWLSIIFALIACALVFAEGEMEIYHGAVIFSLIFLTLWAHLKTMFGDPGAVPSNAFPIRENNDERSSMHIAMCGRCDGFKPPGSHHGKWFVRIVESFV